MNTLSPDIKQAVEEKIGKLVERKSGILVQKVVAASCFVFGSIITLIGGVKTFEPNQTASGIVIGASGLVLGLASGLLVFKALPEQERQAEDDFLKGMKMQENLERLEKRLSVLRPTSAEMEQNLETLEQRFPL